MAQQTLRLTFTWENGVDFKLASKLNSDDQTTVVEMEENGQIDELWPYIDELCKAFFAAQLNTIGDEMKA